MKMGKKEMTARNHSVLYPMWCMRCVHFMMTYNICNLYTQCSRSILTIMKILHFWWAFWIAHGFVPVWCPVVLNFHTVGPTMAKSLSLVLRWVFGMDSRCPIEFCVGTWWTSCIYMNISTHSGGPLPLRNLLHTVEPAMGDHIKSH